MSHRKHGSPWVRWHPDIEAPRVIRKGVELSAVNHGQKKLQTVERLQESVS